MIIKVLAVIGRSLVRAAAISLAREMLREQQNGGSPNGAFRTEDLAEYWEGRDRAELQQSERDQAFARQYYDQLDQDEARRAADLYWQ